MSSDKVKSRGGGEGQGKKQKAVIAARPSAPKTAMDPEGQAPSFKEVPAHSKGKTVAVAVPFMGGPSYKDQVRSTRGYHPVVSGTVARKVASPLPSSLKQDIGQRDDPPGLSRGIDPPPKGAHLPTGRDREQTPTLLRHEHPADSASLPDTASRQPSSSPVDQVNTTSICLDQDHTMPTEREDEDNAMTAGSWADIPSHRDLVQAELVEQDRSDGLAGAISIYEAQALGSGMIMNRRRLVLLIVTVLVIFGAILGIVFGIKGSSTSSPCPPLCTKERPVSMLNMTTDRYSSLLRIFSSLYKNAAFSDESEENPRFRALHWVTNEDPLELHFNSSDYESIMQRYVLAVFYFSTKGWCWAKNTHWLEGIHECRWQTVTCNYEMSVIGFDASDNNVDGTLPSELGDLDQLEYLNLANNPLSGVIPSQLGKPQNLRSLSFGSDKVKGRMTGTLPTELGQLGMLEFLSISSNQFTGPIPEEFGKLTNMTELYCSENQLNGTVPESVLNLPLMNKIQLHDNFFVGDWNINLCDPKSPFQYRSGSSLELVGGDCFTTKEVDCSCCSFCCDPDICCEFADRQTGNRTCLPRSDKKSPCP